MTGSRQTGDEVRQCLAGNERGGGAALGLGDPRARHFGGSGKKVVVSQPSPTTPKLKTAGAPPTPQEARASVRLLYKEVLGRQPEDEDVVMAWAKNLVEPTFADPGYEGGHRPYTVDELRQLFYGSEEYKALEAGGRGIGTGKHPGEVRPSASDTSIPEAQAAALKERERQRRSRGRASTVLLSGETMTKAQDVVTPTLLGIGKT